MQEKLYNCGEPEDENTLRLQFFQVLDHCTTQYFDEVGMLNFEREQSIMHYSRSRCLL